MRALTLRRAKLTTYDLVLGDEVLADDAGHLAHAFLVLLIRDLLHERRDQLGLRADKISGSVHRSVRKGQPAMFAQLEAQK